MTDGRTKRVTFYVDAEEREALKREADAAGLSMSSYILDLVRRQRQIDAEEEVVEEFDVEDRLDQLLTEGLEEFEEVARKLRDDHETILRQIAADDDGDDTENDSESDNDLLDRVEDR